MGKNRKFKIIRKMAANMPELLTTKKKVEVVSGQTVLDHGVTELDGEQVKPETLYYKQTNIPLNHEKEMKHLYLKHGAAGVRAYVQNVDDHVNQIKNEKEKVKGED